MKSGSVLALLASNENGFEHSYDDSGGSKGRSGK